MRREFGWIFCVFAQPLPAAGMLLQDDEGAPRERSVRMISRDAQIITDIRSRISSASSRPTISAEAPGFSNLTSITTRKRATSGAPTGKQRALNFPASFFVVVIDNTVHDDDDDAGDNDGERN